MPLTIKWAREKLVLDYNPDLTIAALRQSISDFTALPLGSFKLIHSGAVLQNDNYSLAAANIKDNATLGIIELHLSSSYLNTIPSAVIGSTARPKDPTSATTKPEESTICHAIQKEMSYVSDLTPSLEAFITFLTQTQEQPILPAHTKEHTRLGELLLQSLLRLDAISTDGEWEDARRDRKAGVRQVQSLLDQLDEAWRAKNST